MIETKWKRDHKLKWEMKKLLNNTGNCKPYLLIRKEPSKIVTNVRKQYKG